MIRKRKNRLEEPEITAWPSTPPEDVGSIAPPEAELTIDCDDLGSRFLSDAVEQGSSAPLGWHDELEELPFDPQRGNDLLRSMGLLPAKKRASKPPSVALDVPPKSLVLAPPPEEFEEYLRLTESVEIDLTEENIREASLLDREGEEPGEIESPSLRTDDTHTHGKRRGGHAPASARPPRYRHGV